MEHAAFSAERIGDEGGFPMSMVSYLDSKMAQIITVLLTLKSYVHSVRKQNGRTRETFENTRTDVYTDKLSVQVSLFLSLSAIVSEPSAPSQDALVRLFSQPKSLDFELLQRATNLIRLLIQ